MSFHVKDDFVPGTPISAIGCDWFNKVGGFVNAFAGGLGLKMFKPSRPSVSAPVLIEIDVDNAKAMLDAAKDGKITVAEVEGILKIINSKEGK